MSTAARRERENSVSFSSGETLGETPEGAHQGDRGSKLPPTGIETKWTAGGVAEVGWMVAANHGGGYVALPVLCCKSKYCSSLQRNIARISQTSELSVIPMLLACAVCILGVPPANASDHVLHVL